MVDNKRFESTSNIIGVLVLGICVFVSVIEVACIELFQHCLSVVLRFLGDIGIGKSAVASVRAMLTQRDHFRYSYALYPLIMLVRSSGVVILTSLMSAKWSRCVSRCGYRESLLIQRERCKYIQLQ